MQQAAVNLPSEVRVGSRTVRIQQRLGNGAFGVVYKVKDEASSIVYALKDVLCLNASALRNAVREATTLNKIYHQNLIAVMGADDFRDGKGLHMLLLTEYCSGGSLNDRLARSSSEEMNAKWVCQTAAALAHLHSRGVVHRDLKADNVLLTATEDVKLADFDLAREYTALKRIDVKQDEASWLASYTQYYMNSGLGPVHWVAPEFFAGRYNEKADVFSLGTLFFAILERDFIEIDGKAIYGAFVNIPGEGKRGLGLAMAEVNSGISITFSSRAQGSNAMQRVVLDALQYDKNNRPSAQEICVKAMNIRPTKRMELFQVGQRRFMTQKKLGEGAFGAVYQVKDQISSEMFALKDIRCENESALNTAVSEAKNLYKVVSHKNIITIQGVDTCTDHSGSRHFLILIELCAGGSLNERLTRPSSDQMNVKWMSQIADALSYLHSKGIVHRDLKPENVLLTNKQDVKMVDFGLAREYIALKRADPMNEWLTIYKQYYIDTFAGSPHWMAPGVFRNHYTQKADVFSLGVIFFAILERDYDTFQGKRYYGAFVQLKWAGKVGLGLAIHRNKYAEVEFSLTTQGSTSQRRLTLDALSYNADDRPTAKDVYERIRLNQEIVKLTADLEGVSRRGCPC